MSKTSKNSEDLDDKMNGGGFLEDTNTGAQYVIGIGASAGGLEAIHELFDNLPLNTNFSFVIIQHLSPDYKSLMAELLTKHTQMRVYEAAEGMLVEPDCVYVIPTKKNLTIKGGRLRLTEKTPSQSAPNTAIDIFFKSLAQDMGSRAIGIILSGTGTDGTKGIEAIKKAGGMVMVQDPISAKFDGMPNSAITSGHADYILAPELMPEELFNFVKQSPMVTAMSDGLSAEDEETLAGILGLIRNQTLLDFTYYKRPTITRRISRRMALNNISSLRSYLQFLYNSPSEVGILCKEFLIGVTKFFRDTEAFDCLAEQVIPVLLDRKNFNEAIKVWVAGCSTGEEAYSMAILFKEELERKQKNIPVKIFATDIDREAIDFAAKGCYPDAISKDVSTERLEKYFIREGDKYKVLPELRKMVIFAHHDLIKDPPFSRIDLISCRNMLIYLNPVLQKKILASFHFSLNLGGFLFLGSSESVGELKNFLSDINKKWKIYKNIEASQAYSLDAFGVPGVQLKAHAYQLQASKSSRSILQSNLVEMLNDAILEEYGYAGVYIDDNYEIVQAMGDFKNFLELPEKRLNLNILKMVSQELSVILGAGIRKAIKNGEKVVMKGVKLHEENTSRSVKIVIRPIPNSNKILQKFILILFMEEKKETYAGNAKPSPEVYSSNNERFIDLEQELKDTRESLQAAIEELETSNEELQSANEELLSANEELQSTNEELQSLNEELHTVNSEHQLKIKELIELNDDLNNYFRTTDIGQIFVDRNLIIRKFSPAVTHQINLIDGDIGRSITHISNNIKYDKLNEDITRVIRTQEVFEIEIELKSGKWYQMRILPYIRQDKQYDGVVITFVDISELKGVEEKLRKINMDLESMVKERSRELSESEERFRLLTTTTNDAVWDWNIKDNLLWWSEGFNSRFGYKNLPEERGIEGWYNKIYPDDKKNVEEGVRRFLAGTDMEWSQEYRLLRADQNLAYILTRAYLMRDEEGKPQRMLASLIDLTELKEAQKDLEETNSNLMRINADLDSFIYTASHDLKAPVANIEGLITTLDTELTTKTEEVQFIVDLIKDSVEKFKFTIRDLSEITKIQKESKEDLSLINIRELVEDVKLSIRNIIISSDAHIVVDCETCPEIQFSRKNLKSIIYNLLSNAVKYRYPSRRPEVHIRTSLVGKYVVLSVKDNGLGIDPEKKDKIFKMFKRLHDHVEGSGVGLYIVKKIIENAGGMIEVESELGKGTEFKVYFKNI